MREKRLSRRGFVQLSGANLWNLGRPGSTLTRSGSVSCFVLHQQASRLEKELEMHHGFYRTPLVPGRLKSCSRSFQARPVLFSAIFRRKAAASVVRRSTTGGLMRTRSSGSIEKSGMAI